MTANARSDLSDAPLILTLRLDGASFRILDEARRTHFPTHLNFVPAHVSLFHHLPGAAHAQISVVLASVAQETAVFQMQATGLRNLGFGVAYELCSPELLRLRRCLVDRLNIPFTRQDQRPFRAHVTIQNKAPAAQARETMRALQADFTPFTLCGEGLCLWRYLNGPWQLVDSFHFSRPNNDEPLIYSAEDKRD